MRLFFEALVEGLIAGISPCVLPVLPVVFAGWALQGSVDAAAGRRRSLAVVAGVVVSFVIATMVGITILRALHLPDDFLLRAGEVLVGLAGLALLVPPLARLISAPFSRVVGRPSIGTRSGFVLGLGLGVVFTPCAGPLLTALVVASAANRVGFTDIVVAFVFAVGAVTPMLVLALAGEGLSARSQAIRRHAVSLRRVGGVVLVGTALVIGFNWAGGSQRWLPGYTTALQKAVEDNGYTTAQQRALAGGTGSVGVLANCVTGQTTLERCGTAPPFSDITAWLNTPHGAPLTWASLRGKVVLVDIYTYSCINCQRTLPHVEAWARAYAHDGFEVVGVESPEFAFEHVVSNVQAASTSLGIHYPIAVDDQLATFDEYGTYAWPTEALVNPDGDIVHVSAEEGDYADTERLIRELLTLAHPGVTLPAPTEVANQTPNFENESPETYLGAAETGHYSFLANATLTEGRVENYPLEVTPALFTYTMGGPWLAQGEDIDADGDSQLTISFEARNVYLVMAGTGTITVTLNGVTHDVAVGGFPTLYRLVHLGSTTTGTLHLTFTPGLRAYDFTFG